MLDTGMYELGQKLTRIGPYRPQEVCQFPYFPVCNEAGWEDTYRRLENDLPNSSIDKSPLGVALLFGESHFISLLPLLAEKGIGLAVLADIQPRMERGTRVLLKCFESSESIEDFKKNFKENELLLVEDTNSILDKYTNNENMQAEFHFLSSDSRYKECKEALKSVVVSHIHYNIYNQELSGVIAKAIREAGAKISLVNINNIYNYDTPYWMRSSLRSLLNHSPDAFILYSFPDNKVFGSWNSAISEDILTFTGLMDYHRGTLHAHVVRHNIGNRIFCGVRDLLNDHFAGVCFKGWEVHATKPFMLNYISGDGVVSQTFDKPEDFMEFFRSINFSSKREHFARKLLFCRETKAFIDMYKNYSHLPALKFDPKILDFAELILSKYLDAMKPNATSRPLQFQSMQGVANVQNKSHCGKVSTNAN